MKRPRPLAAIKVHPVQLSVTVRDGTATYTLPDGTVVATASLAEHIACPTCGTTLPGETHRKPEAPNEDPW